jgi:mycothione reductase
MVLASPGTSDHYDLAIIGTGSGNSIVGPAMDHWRIAMVEEWSFGGTCLNRGCIPTKMLVHPADLAEQARHASALGVDLRIEQVRWRDIRDRVFGRIDPIAAGGADYRMNRCPNITVHAGRGRFTGPKRLTVALNDGGESTITADRIVVAVGGRPMIPDIPGLADAGYHTSDDIMRVDDVPRHLIVLGGGFIACELAHVFGSFGAEITIVQRRGHLLMAEDADVAAALTAAFAERFDLRLNRHVEQVRGRNGESVSVTLDDGSIIEGSDILVATGRVTNIDRIDAIAGGLLTDGHGSIVVDEYQRTAVDGVFALGDVSSPYLLKHVANHEARVVAHNLLHPTSMIATNHRAVPHAVFTRPQIARVGMTEEEARAAGLDVMVTSQRFGDVAYGWAMEDTTSFCKLIADRATRRLIGAHLIGPHASSLIQQLIQGMVFDQTIDEMARGMYYIHPALPEVVENALLQFPSVAG